MGDGIIPQSGPLTNPGSTAGSLSLIVAAKPESLKCLVSKTNLVDHVNEAMLAKSNHGARMIPNLANGKTALEITT